MTKQTAAPADRRKGALTVGRTTLALVAWAAAAIWCASLGWAGLSVTVVLLVAAVGFGFCQVGEAPSPSVQPPLADRPRADPSREHTTETKHESD